MYTVWHVDKYKITFKLVINSRRISRGPAVEKHWSILPPAESVRFSQEESRLHRHTQQHLDLGLAWRTCGARAQNGSRKEFLCRGHSLRSLFFYFYFARPVCLHCEEYVIYIYIYIYIYIHTHTHTHISDCVQTVYELPLLPNNTANETVLHTSAAVRSVNWIFIVGTPAWRWVGEYVTLDRTFYSLLF